ncbi:unnamed protein product [Closterium sp. Yama58-4]|nr:unnamed protein product [Closterium sp. Yama58-4]
MAITPSEFRAFWINVVDGQIAVGLGAEPGRRVVLLHKDRNPNLDVRVVLAASWAGFEALCRRYGSEGCGVLSVGGVSGINGANTSVKGANEGDSVTGGYDGRSLTAAAAAAAAAPISLRPAGSLQRQRAEEKLPVVSLPHVDPNLFLLLLTFYYMGRLEVHLALVRPLLSLAHELGAQELQQACEESLRTHGVACEAPEIRSDASASGSIPSRSSASAPSHTSRFSASGQSYLGPSATEEYQVPAASAAVAAERGSSAVNAAPNATAAGRGEAAKSAKSTGALKSTQVNGLVHLCYPVGRSLQQREHGFSKAEQSGAFSNSGGQSVSQEQNSREASVEMASKGVRQGDGASSGARSGARSGVSSGALSGSDSGPVSPTEGTCVPLHFLSSDTPCRLSQYLLCDCCSSGDTSISSHRHNCSSYSDVSVQAAQPGSTVFRAHRVVLCAWSAAFHKMLTSGMREATSHEIVIGGASNEAVSSLLHFFYTGQLPPTPSSHSQQKRSHPLHARPVQSHPSSQSSSSQSLSFQAQSSPDSIQGVQSRSASAAAPDSMQAVLLSLLCLADRFCIPALHHAANERLLTCLDERGNGNRLVTPYPFRVALARCCACLADHFCLPALHYAANEPLLALLAPDSSRCSFSSSSFIAYLTSSSSVQSSAFTTLRVAASIPGEACTHLTAVAASLAAARFERCVDADGDGLRTMPAAALTAVLQSPFFRAATEERVLDAVLTRDGEDGKERGLKRRGDEDYVEGDTTFEQRLIGRGLTCWGESIPSQSPHIFSTVSREEEVRCDYNEQEKSELPLSSGYSNEREGLVLRNGEKAMEGGGARWSGSDSKEGGGFNRQSVSKRPGKPQKEQQQVPQKSTQELLLQETTEKLLLQKSPGFPSAPRVLQYMHDGDKNGMCFHAGTSYGRHPWMNPVLLGTLSVTASSPRSRYTDGKFIVSGDYVSSSFAGPCVEEGCMTAWWCIDLGEKHKLLCNVYTVRQHGSPNHKLQCVCLPLPFLPLLHSFSATSTQSGRTAAPTTCARGALRRPTMDLIGRAFGATQMTPPSAARASMPPGQLTPAPHSTPQNHLGQGRMPLGQLTPVHHTNRAT